jgi:hypothetical protein
MICARGCNGVSTYVFRTVKEEASCFRAHMHACRKAHAHELGGTSSTCMMSRTAREPYAHPAFASSPRLPFFSDSSTINCIILTIRSTFGLCTCLARGKKFPRPKTNYNFSQILKRNKVYIITALKRQSPGSVGGPGAGQRAGPTNEIRMRTVAAIRQPVQA